MRLRTTALLGIGLLVASASVAGAQEGKSKNYPAQSIAAPEKVIYDAATAMEWFRSLSGYNWVSAEEKAKGQQASAMHNNNGGDFRKIAAGSTVMQTYLAGTPNEMTIMIHQDGPNELLINHYCMAKNVPQFRFVKTGKPGEIRFDFDGGTNLDPNVDVHAHSVHYQVIDKDTFIQNATGSSGGKVGELGAQTLHRMPLPAASPSTR